MLSSLVEKTVIGCGYDLVDIERAPGGLLRVYIDFSPEEQSRGNITLSDCEKVSHQLSHVLVVEDVDYERLEVSSPGLDRPLKRMSDYARFVGMEAKVRLRTPVEGMANRRTFQGILQELEGDEIGLEIEEKEGMATILHFTLADVDKANLIPQVNFGSRKK